MAADEILTVRVVSKDGADYICRCPHCGEVMTTDATELVDVRGQQYQHRVRTSYGTAGCDGWLEIDRDARSVRELPPARGVAPTGAPLPFDKWPKLATDAYDALEQHLMNGPSFPLGLLYQLKVAIAGRLVEHTPAGVMATPAPQATDEEIRAWLAQQKVGSISVSETRCLPAGVPEAPEARRERLSKACGEALGWNKPDGVAGTLTDEEKADCGLLSELVPGPKCERCNDTGWRYSDPLDPNSLEPCCEPSGKDGVAAAHPQQCNCTECQEMATRLMREAAAAAGVDVPAKENDRG